MYSVVFLSFFFLVCMYMYNIYPSFTELVLTATVAQRLAYTEQDEFYYLLAEQQPVGR